MRIIETPIFTKRVKTILKDEEYRLLQNALFLRPESGNIIQGSGGLRELRWQSSGRGKRGSSRFIYYWIKTDETILMLLIYEKNEIDELNKAQLKQLKSIVERELK